MLGLAITLIGGVVLRVLVGRLVTLNVDLHVLVLVMVQLLEVKDETLVLEVEVDLTNGLMRAALVILVAKIPMISLMIAVVGVEEGRWIRNVDTLTDLTAAI